jgi:hypothetical protein
MKTLLRNRFQKNIGTLILAMLMGFTTNVVCGQTAPKGPSGASFVGTSVTPTSFVLYWSRATDVDGDLSGYKVSINNNPIVSLTDTFLVVNNLVSGVEHKVNIWSYDSNGLKSDTARYSVTTPLDNSYAEVAKIEAETAEKLEGDVNTLFLPVPDGPQGNPGNFNGQYLDVGTSEFQYAGINISEAGNYLLEIKYRQGGTGASRRMLIAANPGTTAADTILHGEDLEVLGQLPSSGPSLGWSNFGFHILPVKLIAGNNVLYLKSLYNNGPDIDSFRLLKSKSTGIADNKLSGLKIYPNPAANSINVSLSNMNSNIDVSIYSITGGLLVNRRFLSSDAIVISTNKLNNGIYILKVKDENGKSMQKQIVIKK